MHQTPTITKKASTTSKASEEGIQKHFIFISYARVREGKKRNGRRGRAVVTVAKRKGQTLGIHKIL